MQFIGEKTVSVKCRAGHQARFRKDLEPEKRDPARASFSKDGCYHSESVNVL